MCYGAKFYETALSYIKLSDISVKLFMPTLRCFVMSDHYLKFFTALENGVWYNIIFIIRVLVFVV